MKLELRPENVKLRVKPTNKPIYQLKHGGIGVVRVHDKALQAAQEPLVKAMYRTMRMAEGIDNGSMDPSSVVDHCMDIVAMSANSMLQIDQVRRDIYKPVLPPDLKGLVDRPAGDHELLFGDDLPARQKEITATRELAQSFERPQQFARSTPHNNNNNNNNNPYRINTRTTPYSGRPSRYHSGRGSRKQVAYTPYSRPTSGSRPGANNNTYNPTNLQGSSKNFGSLPKRKPAGGYSKWQGRR